MKFDMRALSNPFEGNFVEVCSIVSNQFAVKSAIECGVDAQKSSIFIGVRPEVGVIRLCKMLGKLDESVYDWYRLQTTIASFLSGLTNTVNYDGAITLPITIAGHTFTESKYTINGEGELLTVCLANGEVVEYQKVEVCAKQYMWRCVSNCQQEMRLGTYKTIPVVDPNWIEAWNFEQTVYPDSRNCSDEFIDRIEEAYEFLQEHSPEYYLWSVALVEEISGIPPHISNSLNSQSFSFFPGHIHISYCDNLYQNLDCIIHENSHLYFNLVEWVEPVCKPNAPSVFSSLKKQMRPFKTILLAYHAIGNLFLLLLKLRQRGVKRQLKNLDKAILFNSNIVEGLESILEEKKEFLSTTGLHLFLPLQQKISEMAIEL